MNKKMRRKIRIIFLVFCLTFMSVMPVFADILSMKSTPITNYRIYHNILDWGVDSNSGLSFFTLNGEPAFCIQAGRAVRGVNGELFYPSQSNSFNVDYTVSVLTKDNSVQSKVAYLGYYSLENPTIKDYTFTQMMIWQTLPAQSITANGMTNGKYNSYFINSSVRAEYEKWKANIQDKIDTWNIRPSFDYYNGGTINITAGETITLTDSNGVLEDYNAFTYSGNGITITHTAKSNSLKVVAAKTSNQRTVRISENTLRSYGCQKYDTKAQVNYVYEAGNSQDMAIYGVTDPVPLALSFNVDIITGRIAINKTKTPDAASDQTLPEEGAKFQVYLKSAGSYEAASDDSRDIITTNASGYAITKDLIPGTYIVHQTAGAEGHKFIEDFEVVIKQEEHDKVYTYDVTNETLQSKIQIVKKDAETGKTIPMAGTEYELTNLATNEKIEGTSSNGNFVTDENGVINLPQPLYYGEYSLKEIKAPDGYVLSTDPLIFTVDGSQETLVVEQFDTAQKGKISINKIGERLASWEDNDDGTYTPIYEEGPIEGTVYEVRADGDVVTNDGTVRYTDGQLVATITTDEKGQAISPELYLGSYVVNETKLVHSNVREKYAQIRKINKEEDFDKKVRYYSDEYIRVGNSHFNFVRLYDENFDLLEDVTIVYTNLLKNLTEITDKPDAIAMAAYHLEPLEKGFYRICKTEYTEQALESISKTIAKESGWRV